MADVGREATGLDFAQLDLKEWPLPMDDEPDVPAHGKPYKQAHTRAWSDKVAGSDAFIIVTPQYNWGYPASLKNAIDHLYKEWNDKPLMIVSYGGQGGTKAALQLRLVAESLKMRVVAVEPALTLPKETIGGGTPLDPKRPLPDTATPSSKRWPNSRPWWRHRWREGVAVSRLDGRRWRPRQRVARWALAVWRAATWCAA